MTHELFRVRRNGEPVSRPYIRIGDAKSFITRYSRRWGVDKSEFKVVRYVPESP